MEYWLIIFLFTAGGEFIVKEYKTASMEECRALAASYTGNLLVNTQLQAQFHCVSDDHYMGRKQDEGIDYD